MLGTQIKKLRTKHSWTQNAFAKKLHVSPKTVKNWETDISDPSVHNIIGMASLFHITSDDLLGIQTKETISLDGLSETEQQKIKAIVQLYIQLTIK